MAHFDYTRPAGVWAAFVPVRASELADLDRKTFKAINGDDGGTWAPSAPIAIGGQGLEIAEHASIRLPKTASAIFGDESQALFENGAALEFAAGSWLFITDGAVAEVEGAIVVRGGTVLLESGATATFDGTTAKFENGGAAVFESGTTAEFKSGAVAEFANGSTADFKPGALAQFASRDWDNPAIARFDGFQAYAEFKNGATAVFQGADVDKWAGATFLAQSGATFESGSSAGFVAGSELWLGGKTTFQPGGTHELKGALVASGAGRVTKRIVDGPDANAAFSIETADVVYVPGITANRTYTILATGAKQGDVMRVFLGTSFFTLTVKDGVTNETLRELVANAGNPGTARALDIAFHSGQWRVIGIEYMP